MAFRATFVLAYLVFVLNFGSVLGLGFANVVEKGLFLASAMIFIATRPLDRFVLTYLVVALGLVLFCSIATDYPNFSWAITINSLNQFLIIFALLAGVASPKDREVILSAVAWVPVACVVIGSLYQAVGWSQLFSREYASGLYRLGGTVIPSFLSGLAMCGVFSALQRTLDGRRHYLPIFVINLVILLLAGGRMAIAVTAMSCFALIFMQKNISVGRKFSFMGFALILLFPILVFFGDLIVTRFSSSGANGRDILWSHLQNLSTQYPIFGVGFGNATATVPQRIINLTGSAAAHNDYLRLSAELGQVNVWVFYGLLSLAVLRVAYRKKNPGGTIMLTGYLGFLLLSLTDNALATPPYFPIIFLAYLANLAQARKSASEHASSTKPSLPRYGATA
jgi:O-antigen ligase